MNTRSDCRNMIRKNVFFFLPFFKNVQMYETNRSIHKHNYTQSNSLDAHILVIACSQMHDVAQHNDVNVFITANVCVPEHTVWRSTRTHCQPMA